MIIMHRIVTGQKKIPYISLKKYRINNDPRSFGIYSISVCPITVSHDIEFLLGITSQSIMKLRLRVIIIWVTK